MLRGRRHGGAGVQQIMQAADPLQRPLATAGSSCASIFSLSNDKKATGTFVWLGMKDLLRGVRFSPGDRRSRTKPCGVTTFPVWLRKGGEIPALCVSAATSSPAPCGSPDLSKWDKMFSMLENSQMRENMLLQYADDIIKVEIGSLRGEMLRLVHTCTPAIRKWQTPGQVQGSEDGWVEEGPPLTPAESPQHV